MLWSYHLMFRKYWDCLVLSWGFSQAPQLLIIFLEPFFNLCEVLLLQLKFIYLLLYSLISCTVLYFPFVVIRCYLLICPIIQNELPFFILSSQLYKNSVYISQISKNPYIQGDTNGDKEHVHQQITKSKVLPWTGKVF